MKITRRRTKKKSPRRIRTDAPRTWLLLASSAQTVTAHAEEIRGLASAGHVVRLGYRGGRLPVGLPRGRHRLGTYRTGPIRPLTAALTAALTAPLPLARKLSLAAERDRWLAEIAPVADDIVFLDQPAAQHLLERVTALAPAAQVWLPAQAARVLAEEAAWRELSVGAVELDGRLPAQRITLSRVLAPAEKLTELAEAAPLRRDLARDVRPELRRLSRWALRRGRFDRVDSLLAITDLLRGMFGPDGREDAAVAALRAHVALVRDEDPGAPVVELVGSVLDQADVALGIDDVKEASELGAIALGLAFHQQLHTATMRTPLVEEPDVFLAPLRKSRIGQLLALADARPLGPESLFDTEGEGEDAAGLTHEDAELNTPSHLAEAPAVRTDNGSEGRLRVCMLPGVYAHHAVPLLEALDTHEGVELTTVRLTGVPFRGMMIDAPLLQYRIEHALGRVPTVGLQVTREELEAVRSADVVVADWADKGAAWASTVVPDGTRMVVRVHSVDALSAPAQLVDWSRVDDVVFVADHIRDLFLGVLGERVGHVRTHVVTNIVPPEKFPDPLLPDASRTLGVVGWGQVVKDPTFALDVLEILVRDDKRWRLRLIGTDFGQHHAAAAQEYAATFRRRALQDNIVDQIDYTGFTRQLADHLRHVGFILNTSRREGCPVGTLEGTAAGAFPVVRDWPTFAALDGAGRLFPRRCVVTTPQEAAQLIQSLADDEQRRRAVAEVRQDMAEQFSDAGTRDRLLEVIIEPQATNQPQPQATNHPQPQATNQPEPQAVEESER
ncbi:glycosyltransferase [Ornithinimicrobium pratense]|uniref:Glycosyltransferase family 4 protein n=1 Tax=Ornithinimicrobium pratense TaxID=2593973 RepID=A0A5J6V965_9MICO|nr:glycosyltransferase [Ornithinimicrobium pratense]QFG70017.1 glycosyltransferase family 4 protein [Ornithinimicrobium pratense]